MSKPTIPAVARDLAYLEEAWPNLVMLKIPGTARSWVETPRRRGVLSEADRERLGKKGVPRQAPADVNVLDLLASIAAQVEDIASCVVEVAGLGQDALVADRDQGRPWAYLDPNAVQIGFDWFTAKFLPDRPASVDPRPWLVVGRMWLTAAQEANEDTVPWVGAQLHPLVSAAARLLGDVRDGQVMNGICPWCKGQTWDTTAGERTLQIHYPVADDADDEPLIICTGMNCSPPSSACGQHRGGHPAWPRREWDWLSTMLLAPTHDTIERQTA